MSSKDFRTVFADYSEVKVEESFEKQFSTLVAELSDDEFARLISKIGVAGTLIILNGFFPGRVSSPTRGKYEPFFDHCWRCVNGPN